MAGPASVVSCGACWTQTPLPQTYGSAMVIKKEICSLQPLLWAPHIQPTLPLSPGVLNTHHDLCCVGKTSPEALWEVAGLS